MLYLGMTAPTARSALNLMTNLDILKEVSGKKRDKVYVYRKYLDILESDAEPFTLERHNNQFFGYMKS